MTSRWLLVVAVTPERSTNGRAFDRRLSLEFASDCIAAYRVIGYGPPEDRAAGRPKDDDDDRPATPSVAVVLCEIEMKDGCQRGDDIVRVSLEPADDASSDSRSKRISAVLRASDFSSDFDAAPLIWRQAALVGLAAERFAGSPFAEEHPLGEIAALAQQLEPEVYDRAGWQEFIAALARAQSLQSSLLRAF